MGMYGIDISEHNGEISLLEYKDQFVMIRAGWGWSAEQKDKMFDRNVKECIRLQIPFGVYWYCYSTDLETAKLEAEAILEVIEPYREEIRMGVWIDQEDADGWRVNNGLVINRTNLSSMSYLMCSMIEEAGYYTGIYCSYSWLKFMAPRCDRIDKWVAHWGTNDGTKQNDTSRFGSLHQFTDTPLDRYYCYTDLDKFIPEKK